jgi:hypothetical protein
MKTIEQDVYEAILHVSGNNPFETIEDAREFFGPKAWPKVVELINARNNSDAKMEVRWGNDDLSERGYIRMGDGVPIKEYLNLDGWDISLYHNNVLEFHPRGSSGAGPVVVCF